MLFDVTGFGVGERIPEFAIGSDCCMVQMEGGLLGVNVLVNRPTQKMIHDGDDTGGFEITLWTYRDVMNFAIKVGAWPWQDAPFTPHLCPGLVLTRDEYVGGETMPILYRLVDSSDGRVLAMHIFASSTQFSNRVLRAIKELREKEFSYIDYRSKVEQIQRAYRPKDIAKMAEVRFKHRQG